MSDNSAKPAEPKKMRPERISYKVNKDEPAVYANLITSGPEMGKYKDERTGLLYDTSSEWIRAMVRFSRLFAGEA